LSIDPPPPFHPASVSSPRTKGSGGHTRRAVMGWGPGGQYFGKPDIGLASYSIIPLLGQRDRDSARDHLTEASQVGLRQHIYIGFTLFATQQCAYLSWQKQKYNTNVSSVAGCFL
jgi:hypothetical protein